MTAATPGASAPAPEPHLRLERLTKHFGGVVAVDNVSVSVAGGEFITLLGPSGSGKTTTLMMIAGFEDPTIGEIYLDGEPLAGVPSYRRNFGMVFQNYALFPHRTVAENVEFPLKMRKVPKARRRDMVAGALELVQLPEYGARYPNQLSGGQQQRIALARALVFNPAVLLMDEPLGALDRKLREDMQLEIKRLQKQLNITTIYVTHDQEEALVLSDRIAVVNHGRFEQVDDPTTLYERPATTFVADFVGESNILPVTVARHGTEWRGEAAGGQRLTLPPNMAFADGSRVNLIVRPEKVRLVGAAAAQGTSVSGTVREAVYVGDITRYVVDAGDGLSIVARIQNRAGEARAAEGDTVTVGWHVSDTAVVGAGDDPL